MITIMRTRTRQALRAEAAAAEKQAAAARAETRTTAERAETVIAELREDLARAVGELSALRAQDLLDTEDRAALRMLLRTTRKQRTDRVFVLFRYGALHSVHPTAEAAEKAAEAEGAPRAGWTAARPGAAMPPASEVPWRVQQLPLGSVAVAGATT